MLFALILNPLQVVESALQVAVSGRVKPIPERPDHERHLLGRLVPASGTPPTIALRREPSGDVLMHDLLIHPCQVHLWRLRLHPRPWENGVGLGMRLRVACLQPQVLLVHNVLQQLLLVLGVLRILWSLHCCSHKTLFISLLSLDVVNFVLLDFSLLKFS